IHTPGGPGEAASSLTYDRPSQNTVDAGELWTPQQRRASWPSSPVTTRRPRWRRSWPTSWSTCRGFRSTSTTTPPPTAPHRSRAKAGAHVRTEPVPGKGNVVRRAFADLDADVYLLVDGDDTYDIADAPRMIKQLLAGPHDHVLGVRREAPGAAAYRPGHERGNRFFNRLVTFTFGVPVSDMLSGYRVMSRRFVKSFPALSHEFEIE